MDGPECLKTCADACDALPDGLVTGSVLQVVALFYQGKYQATNSDTGRLRLASEVVVRHIEFTFEPVGSKHEGQGL